MALFWAPAVFGSLATRVVEYTTDYDGKIKAYIKLPNDERWQAIMDNIALYPNRHSFCFVAKAGCDAVLLGTAARSVYYLLKGLANDVWTSIKACYDSFCEFLINMYNSAKDLYHASQKMSLRDMVKRITDGIASRWNDFITTLTKTLKLIKTKACDLWKWIKSWINIDVARDPQTGKVILTRSGSAVPLAFIPMECLESARKTVYATITSIWTAIFSGLGMLVSWVAGQLEVEYFKYVCSACGLAQYWFNRVPRQTQRMRIDITG